MIKLTKILLGAALAVPFTGCSSVQGSLERSRTFAADRNYYQAYKVLEAARDPAQPDPDIEKAYWDMRLEYLVDQATRAIFQNREVEALGMLDQAVALAPDNLVVKQLIDKARFKLATRAVDHGDTMLAGGNLAEALRDYTEALRRVSGFAGAIVGTQKVRQEFDRMQGKAQQHFLEALRLYPELRWVQVEWHTGTSLLSSPGRKDVEELQARAKHRLAERSVQRGMNAEKDGLYGAALMEYRAARQEEKEFPGIAERIASMENEVKAEALAEEAFSFLINGEFALAREKLQEALKLTVLEQTAISSMLLETKRREGMQRYQHAKDLELQNEKAEALRAFSEIVAAWPDGLADEKARVDNLEHDIDSATKEWEAAEAAEQQGDTKAALQHYKSVNDFYPDWKDVKARIERLGHQIPK